MPPVAMPTPSIMHSLERLRENESSRLAQLEPGEGTLVNKMADTAEVTLRDLLDHVMLCLFRSEFWPFVWCVFVA